MIAWSVSSARPAIAADKGIKPAAGKATKSAAGKGTKPPKASKFLKVSKSARASTLAKAIESTETDKPMELVNVRGKRFVINPKKRPWSATSARGVLFARDFEKF
jgi:hypothetical protein